MRNFNVDSNMSAIPPASPEYCANQLKLIQTQQQYSAIRHVLKSNKTNNDWFKEFLAYGGFQNLLNNITQVCSPKNRPNNSALSALIACVTVVMGTKQGLDTATSSSSVLSSIILGLISEDELVKRDILTLLSTLTLHSSTAYRYVLESFNHFKKAEHLMYRFVVLVDDLKSTESVEYQKSLLNFINCLIDRSTLPDRRIDLRNEIIALGLLDVLRKLRNTQNSSVAQQIIHFYEQKAKDEMKLLPSLDVNNPTAMFTLLWKKIANTPRSHDLMKIVQKLLFTVDTSDLWSAAIDALSGPRTTQGVFKDTKTANDSLSNEKERFPEPPESSGGYSPPQRLNWRVVSSETTLERSVWARVNRCQNKINVKNIQNFFFQSQQSKQRLRYITEDVSLSLNLLLASLDSNNNRSAAIKLITSALIEGDTTIVPELCLRRLHGILPSDPALMTAISEFNGELDTLDSSELLLVSISRIPEYQTRLKCMLGRIDIPQLLDQLEECETHYSNIIKSLLDLECPFFNLLKLVLDIGNTLNEEALVTGFKLEALNQLKSMRAPRQPSLTLLHFVTQSLAKGSPATLDFLAELQAELGECKKQTIGQFDEELRQLEVQLRDIRSLLVVAANDIKIQFTSVIVDSGKRVTCLKNKRKSLENRIHDFAEFYCESSVDFSLSSYFSSLSRFCNDIVECKEICDLTSLTADNKAGYSPELKCDDDVTAHHPDPSCNDTCNEPLFSPRVPPRTHCGSITSAYGSSQSEYSSTSRRETNESETSVFTRCDTLDSDTGYQGSSRHNSEDQGVSLESRLTSPPPPPPKPLRPVGVIYDNNRDIVNFRTPEKSTNKNTPYRRSGDLKKLHSNYRSVDLSYNRSRSHDYYDKYHSAEYRSGPGRDRYRHSPPTREKDEVQDESEEETSSEEEESEEDTLPRLPAPKPPSPAVTRSESDAQRPADPPPPPRSRGHESRSVGHAGGAVPPVSYLNTTFGGSCRSFQNPRYQRKDVRDLFANIDRERYGSTSSINSGTKDKIIRGSRENPQQSSIQAMLRGDQNSRAPPVIKREPPPVPKRDKVPGMGRKETSRSTPALNHPYIGRTPRSFSISPPSLSPPSLSPPSLSPEPSLSPPPGTLSPPLSLGTLSPPLSLGTLSPPPVTFSPPPVTLSPPTRYGRERPVSAGAKKELTIDENTELHHEKQSSEPYDMRYSLENVRLSTRSSSRNLSRSSSEISTTGLETEV